MEVLMNVKDESKFPDKPFSCSKDLTETLPEEAFNNFLEGKRRMHVQDYSCAVQSLSSACEMYTQHFGEMASECGELHFLYGKALFFFCQEEESKENEESEKNYSDKINSLEYPVDAEEGGDGDERKEPSESTASLQHVEGSSEEAHEKENEAPVAAKKEDSSNEEQQKIEKDELELAWDSLERAKIIFQREGENVEAQLKVAEILQLQAEMSLGRIHDEAAINDLKTCLEIKKRYLKPDDRRLARVYLRLGLAKIYNLKKMYAVALDDCRTAVNILESPMESLKSPLDANVQDSFDRTDTVDFEDLELVLSEIREETRELTEDAKTAIEYGEKAIGKRITVKGRKIEKVGLPNAEKDEKKRKSVDNTVHLLVELINWLILFFLIVIFTIM